MGADHCIQVTREMTAKDIAQKVKEYLGDLASQTIECTGAEPSVCAGIYVSRSVNKHKPTKKML